MWTVPVSLLGAFIMFPPLGFSVNVLTLFGLVLAIGIVVDDAIVVVEAVQHHIEHGMDPGAATESGDEGSVRACGRDRFSVVRGLRAGGLHGRRYRPVYRQFALTIAVAVIFSVINALTLSPALAAKMFAQTKARARARSRNSSSCLIEASIGRLPAMAQSSAALRRRATLLHVAAGGRRRWRLVHQQIRSGRVHSG